MRNKKWHRETISVPACHTNRKKLTKENPCRIAIITFAKQFGFFRFVGEIRNKI